MSTIFSFDIGHASIGWAAMQAQSASEDPRVLGTGVVLFPADDCLASERRKFRRMRRHIRSTRQRIARLRAWLVHCGVIAEDVRDRPGHPAPFLLAAAALQGHRELTGRELWDVLRWYAHNRGYDGNAAWAGPEDNPEDEEDTEKIRNANALMDNHHTRTMAETVCACLELDPAKSAEKIASMLPYRTMNAAYPRKIVRDEVSTILSRHLGKVSGLDQTCVRVILTTEPLGKETRDRLAAVGIRLPLRYTGGLLFGQLVPRFNNRIISRCPITYASIYDEAIGNGHSSEEAARLAERDSKVPSANTREFLDYRFARVLANLRADGLSLSAEVRQKIHALAKQRGKTTAAELKRYLEGDLGLKATNINDYFKLHPDSEKALVLDPALAFARSNTEVSAIWELLPEKTRVSLLRTWRKGKHLVLGAVLQEAEQAEAGCRAQIESKLLSLKQRGKKAAPSIGELLLKKLSADNPGGRAPYARPVLLKVKEEVLAGFDPTRPARSAKHPDGENKSEDGVLYPLLDPASRVRALQNERPLEKQTNNHKVRHRLLILDRLLDEMTSEFCGGDGNLVTRCIVEVGRDLKEFSGMGAKAIETELNSRLRHFKSAVTCLQNEAPNLKMTGTLIRKCRVAMDLGWKCPFTGHPYQAADLPALQFEHIIPYASRSSNALHGLVLTFPEVNRMKGKRTAIQFVSEFGGQPVEGRASLSIRPKATFIKAVEALDTKGHLEDQHRKKARKALLLTERMDDDSLGFTEGQMTQSSHLMKLALRGITRRFPKALTDPIPGVVTGVLRRSWNLTGTLALACPAILGEDGRPKPKDEIRGETHLHHALDACVLGLAGHYLPIQLHGQNIAGKLWQALVRRRPNPEETGLLRALKLAKFGPDNRFDLAEPPDSVKQQIATRLADRRVMQHVPADMSGAKTEETIWGIIARTETEAVMLQNVSRDSRKLVEGSTKRKWQDQEMGKEARAALEKFGHLLSSRQRSLVERGLLKFKTEKLGKVLGATPSGPNSKLAAINGGVVVSNNYGLALDPEPCIIPHFQVYRRLKELRKQGQPIRVLRPGDRILFTGEGERDGEWRVYSVKANLHIDLVRPHVVGRPDGGPTVWANFLVKSLLKKNFKLLPRSYTAKPC